MAKLVVLPNATEWARREDETWEANSARQDALMATLEKRLQSLADGVIEGTLLRWGRGDGEAIYVVLKDTPLTLAHVPYCDAWKVEAALIRGLRKADVLKMVRATRMWSKAFSEARQRQTAAAV